ncbi:MAG: response regulator, partial [Burkholderiaceae bacterium]|nr:response regulator [Burkholderiaceae bacterium]
MTQPTQCVLLVDDHPLQLQLLQEALSPEFAVRMAQSGEAALREVATQAPDLILLDVLMPDMDGFEVCRRLRAHAHWKDIPVIFVTSMDEATSESEGLALGAADYIVKPFHVVTVRQRVRNLLERERLRQTVERQLDLLQAQMQERARAADRLRLAASVFTHAREGITIAGLDGLIVDVNDAFTRITGYSREEVVGRNPNILSSGRQTKAFYTAMWASLKRNGTWTGEIWNRRKNGEVYAEMLTINTVLDAQGQPSQYVAMFSDITATKNYQNQL